MDEIDFEEVKEEGDIVGRNALSNGRDSSLKPGGLYYYFDEVQEFELLKQYFEIEKSLYNNRSC